MKEPTQYFIRLILKYSDRWSRAGRRLQGRIVRAMARSKWWFRLEWIAARVSRGFQETFRFFVDRFDLWNRRARRLVPKKKKDPKAEKKRLQAALKERAITERHQRALKKTWVSRLGRTLLRPFAGLWYFAQRYWVSRKKKSWLWVVPITLLALMPLAPYAYTRLFSKEEITRKYELGWERAVEAGDTRTADLYQVKLEQLGARADRRVYRAAVDRAEAGDVAGGYELMRTIAPLSRAGFAAAHFWIAQQLLDGELHVQGEEPNRLALSHLEKLAVRNEIEQPVRLMEGVAYYRLGQTPAAINSLRSIAGRNVMAATMLLEIHLNRNERAEARVQAVNLVRMLQQRQREGQSLSELELQWQTVATELVGDREQMQAAVEQWYRANPDSPAARERQAFQLLQQVDQGLVQRGGVPAELAAQLNEAARLVPAEKMSLVHARCQQIVRLAAWNPAVAELRVALSEDVRTAGPVLEFFGTELAYEQQWEASERVLGRACESDPSWAAAWNNRAYVLNKAFPARREEALGYVQKALELQPLYPNYHETRGSILLELGQYEAALEDFEIAVNGTQNLSSVHQSMARAYAALGNDALAESYRNLGKRPGP